MKDKNIKFETLKKRVNIERVLLVIAFIVIIGLVIVNRVSHASFSSSLDVPFVRGTINYKHPDLSVVAMNIQESSGSTTYNETKTMPSGSDYVINSSKSYCTKGLNGEKDTEVVLKTLEGHHVIEKLTKNDRCYLYFDIYKPKNVAEILNTYTKNSSRNGTINGIFTNSTPTTVYSAQDDDGTSYVFAGVNPNNWVKFANYYWRIIRFNGDGSLRLIYNGNSTNSLSSGKQITKSIFNDSSNNNMYVGFKYYYNETHGTTLTSSIETTLDEWYRGNLYYFQDSININAGFCNDRTASTSNTSMNGSGGTGTTTTYYGAYIRLYSGDTAKSSFTPTLKCSNASDLFTTSNSSKGNKALTCPIGLITIDEVAIAGGMGNTANTSYWLRTGDAYWTLSPSYFNQDARVFRVNDNGSITGGLSVDFSYGVRPVINLKSTTTFSSGTGTSTDPYVVKS